MKSECKNEADKRGTYIAFFIGQNFFFEKAQIATMTGDFSAPAKLLLHHYTVATPLAYAWSSPLQSQPASQTSGF